MHLTKITGKITLEEVLDSLTKKFLEQKYKETFTKELLLAIIEKDYVEIDLTLKSIERLTPSVPVVFQLPDIFFEQLISKENVLAPFFAHVKKEQIENIAMQIFSECNDFEKEFISKRFQFGQKFDEHLTFTRIFQNNPLFPGETLLKIMSGFANKFKLILVEVLKSEQLELNKTRSDFFLLQIRDASFSERTQNVLLQAKISNIDELFSNYEIIDLNKFRGFGKKCTEEIEVLKQLFNII
jgi:hypothetical protein